MAAIRPHAAVPHFLPTLLNSSFATARQRSGVGRQTGENKGDVTRDNSQRRFLAQQSITIIIIATLFRVVTTLFEHCNAALRLKSWLRIVLCNITLTL